MRRFSRKRKSRVSSVRRRRYRRGYSKYRSKRFNRATKVVIRSPQITPDRYFAKLKFQAHKQFTTNALQVYSFRGNSVYDPDVAIGGTQPAGFDQLMSLYYNFRVHGSKIRVEYINGRTGQTPPIALVPVNSAAIPGYSDIDQIGEDPYSKSAIMSVAGGSKDRYVIKSYMTTKKFFGYKSINQETDFVGSATLNPNIQFYWNIYAASYDVNNVSIEIRVTVTYFVEFFNRVQVIDA